jgi:2-iminobutanoate/2-iminopropanoate deaminase
MERRAINAPDGPAPAGGYSQAVEVLGARRLLFISGQIPVEPGGRLPTAIENREVRAEVLGDLKPALTVIIAGIFDSEWLIEIEAIAAA